MPAKVGGYRLLRRARQDVLGIWQYTAREWSPEQADRYVATLRDGVARLAEGQAHSRPVDARVQHLRKSVVGSHAVYFRDSNGVVEIVRILHRSMDTSRHL